MIEHLRIATWNLDHASRSNRPIDLQVEQILEIGPDILILTETCKEVSLKLSDYQCISCQPNEYKKVDAAICLGRNVELLEELPTYDKVAAVCVKAKTPLGEVIVYSTIIPYHGYKGRAGGSPAWSEHYKAIQNVSQDWKNLLAKSKGKFPLIAAGDFNQTRDNSTGTYGTKLGRDLLSIELERNDLICLTQEDFVASEKLKPDPSKGYARHNIDHIFVTQDAFVVANIGAWDHFTDAGKYLSDHNGVYVDLTTNSR